MLLNTLHVMPKALYHSTQFYLRATALTNQHVIVIFCLQVFSSDRQLAVTKTK